MITVTKKLPDVVYVICRSESVSDFGPPSSMRYLARAMGESARRHQRGKLTNGGGPQWAWAPSTIVILFKTRAAAEKVLAQISDPACLYKGTEGAWVQEEDRLGWEAAVRINSATDAY